MTFRSSSGRCAHFHATSPRLIHRFDHCSVRMGYVYLHSAVDGYSRLAYTEALGDEISHHRSRVPRPGPRLVRCPRHHRDRTHRYGQWRLLPRRDLWRWSRWQLPPAHYSLHATAQRERRVIQLPYPRRMPQHRQPLVTGPRPRGHQRVEARLQAPQTLCPGLPTRPATLPAVPTDE
jgi:hypothetical protein